ncbi:hypothetical protein G3480_25015 [Thiorhodococcus mannitoliphagus]|uniref:Uncharacterized protein n=1 Tax=Thiorhodococcus mannitoliphagus TaxID=329406 RepID=A0A6P1E652_9GAMM|nr:hypothetical protein [Thiorhodococcus mannitoliphagus]NEX23504.1 hypothetical protein [Thiorhodococcus mannitoliphagus]
MHLDLVLHQKLADRLDLLTQLLAIGTEALSQCSRAAWTAAAVGSAAVSPVSARARRHWISSRAIG